MTCQTNTQDRISAVLARLLCKPEADFIPSAHLDALGADSLDRVEIGMEIEDEFGIELGDSCFEWETVQDILDAVKARYG